MTEEWVKLRTLFGFLKTKNNYQRIFGTDDFLRLETWIYASHVVHPNMRVHTGGSTYFGCGIIYRKPAKQKLNTKSTTDSEVLGMSECVPYKIYIINFLEAQGLKN